jgi:hypothetical protein
MNPRALLDCFLFGLDWMWREARDFLLLASAFALVAMVFGALLASAPLFCGGLALLAALAMACIVYGSHLR